MYKKVKQEQRSQPVEAAVEAWQQQQQPAAAIAQALLGR